MVRVPNALAPLRNQLMDSFSNPATARRVLLLMLAAILVVGSRTVANLLRLISLIECLNPSTYHPVLSHRHWDATRLVRIIIGFLLDRYAPAGVIQLCGDETVDGHRGKKVYGKARHRDIDGGNG